MSARASLGERIAAVEHIRAGRTTVVEVAAHYGMRAAEIDAWVRNHAQDRTWFIDEFRGADPECSRLARQARRLRHLIARADRTLHVLHAQLLASRIHP